MNDGRSHVEDSSTLPAVRTDAGLVTPGETLKGRWRIERVIGTGGMGTVVAARHLGLGHVAAIKILVSTDPEARERFEREARAMSALTSKHIVRVHDVDADGDTPFMVMDLLEGTDLAHLGERGQPSIAEACLWMEQASDALEDAHAHGIIHRDIKPQNLFLARDADGTSSIRVLDFGVARRTSGEIDMVTLTKAGSVIGTLAYMAPEQLRSAKNVDARTDIWGVGACLYRLLTGARPFESTNQLEIVEGILLHEPKAISAYRNDVPPEVEAIVMRCLRKDPAARFASARQLREALVMARTPPTAGTVPMAYPPTRSGLASVPLAKPAPPPAAAPSRPKAAIAPPAPSTARAPARVERRLSLGVVVAFAVALALFLAGVALAILTAFSKH
ncbi:MAG: serine/threonine protein kinase [Deltaproteobacteria bacterium]|nr:serine/threonine protein kinase [Deltaproteobacteria bacterium]